MMPKVYDFFQFSIVLFSVYENNERPVLCWALELTRQIRSHLALHTQPCARPQWGKFKSISKPLRVPLEVSIRAAGNTFVSVHITDLWLLIRTPQGAE